MAGTVSQKPQGLEEGQTGHGMTSGIVGDPWNQPCGSCLPVLAFGLLGRRICLHSSGTRDPFAI